MENQSEKELFEDQHYILCFRFMINAIVGTLVTLFATTAMLIYVIVPQMHAKQDHQTVVSYSSSQKPCQRIF